jgi:hypothetical protein
MSVRFIGNQMIEGDDVDGFDPEPPITPRYSSSSRNAGSCGGIKIYPTGLCTGSLSEALAIQSAMRREYGD